ncbi:MAG: hypothetical protein K2X38_19240 [Gemmataceae bacterium]|nr:hypothetical protein [Gemmataceae bacterium]
MQFSAPMGKAFTTKDAGLDDTIDSDADASGYTAFFTVAAGQSPTDIDAGLVTQAAPNSPPMAMSDSATASMRTRASWPLPLALEFAGERHFLGERRRMKRSC